MRERGHKREVKIYELQSPIISGQREQGCRAACLLTSEEDPDSIGQGDG